MEGWNGLDGEGGAGGTDHPITPVGEAVERLAKLALKLPDPAEYRPFDDYDGTEHSMARDLEAVLSERASLRGALERIAAQIIPDQESDNPTLWQAVTTARQALEADQSTPATREVGS